MSAFQDFPLSSELQSALVKKGFSQPSPIQGLIIPKFFEHSRDLIGKAQTGTGKTAAFGLPVLEKIEPSNQIQSIILTPTRELCVQVAQELKELKGNKKVRISAIYGGQSIFEQTRALKRGVDIVVGTPGRVVDHISRKNLNLSGVRYFVLDEADEMLNMGFIEDIERIFTSSSEDKRVLLFSATMPKQILKVAERFMNDPEVCEVKQPQLTNDKILQYYFEVNSRDRLEALSRVLEMEIYEQEDFYSIIFCKTKVETDWLANKLVQRKYAVEGIHGDISQSQRERILQNFRDKKTKILVATDVAARGIDVQGITHVINYSLPQSSETYVHRIGRTGRAERTGIAYTFVASSIDELRQLSDIKRIAKGKIEKKDLPKVQDILQVKKKAVQEKLLKVVSKESKEIYQEFADILLQQEKDPKKLVSSLIQEMFYEDLDPKKYRELKEPTTLNKSRKVRLFIAMGRQDGGNPRKILERIQQKVSVDSSKIRDIEIYGKFSFFTAPVIEAENIIRAFKTRKGKPLVVRAKQK